MGVRQPAANATNARKPAGATIPPAAAANDPAARAAAGAAASTAGTATTVTAASVAIALPAASSDWLHLLDRPQLPSMGRGG